MAGHIENRTKNPDRTNRDWTLVVENGYKIVDCKRTRDRIKRAFHGTKKAAETELARLETLVQSGMYFDSDNMTVQEFFEKWLEEYVKPDRADKTYLSYKQICDLFIIPKLGALKLDKLKAIHLDQYYNELRVSGRKDKKEGGLAASSLVKHHRIIHKALATAVKKQLIFRNVADLADPPRINKSNMPEANAYDVEMVNKMLAAAVETSHYRELVIAVYTGIRRGELYGLRWQDIDWSNKQIKIRQTVQYTPDKGIFFKPPKTQKGKRNIDITEIEIGILKEQRAEQAKIKLSLDPELDPEYEDNDLVFCQKYGKPMHPDTISSWFPKFLEDNNFPRIRFHDLRHTNITLMLKGGTSVVVAAARAGHAQPSTTSNIYSHALPSMQKEAASKLRNLLTGKKKKRKTARRMKLG